MSRSSSMIGLPKNAIGAAMSGLYLVKSAAETPPASGARAMVSTRVESVVPLPGPTWRLVAKSVVLATE